MSDIHLRSWPRHSSSSFHWLYLSTVHTGEVEYINWKINDIFEFQKLIYAWKLYCKSSRKNVYCCWKQAIVGYIATFQLKISNYVSVNNPGESANLILFYSQTWYSASYICCYPSNIGGFLVVYTEKIIQYLGKKGFYILRIYIMFWGFSQRERYLSVKISSRDCGIILDFNKWEIMKWKSLTS